MRHPVERQQVVLAEGVERDVAGDHELVVALVVREGGEVERLGGEHLGVHARHSPGGVRERLVGDVRAQGMEQVSGRVLGRSDVHGRSKPGDGADARCRTCGVHVAPLVGRVSAGVAARRHPEWMGYPATCALTYAVPSLMPGAKNETPRALFRAPAAVELR